MKEPQSLALEKLQLNSATREARARSSFWDKVAFHLLGKDGLGKCRADRARIQSTLWMPLSMAAIPRVRRRPVIKGVPIISTMGLMPRMISNGAWVRLRASAAPQ